MNSHAKSFAASTRDGVSSAGLPRVARILVIDDEPQIGTTLRLLLAPDCEVLAVTNANEALRRISEREQFDLILCDLMMPEMSGMELYTKLQELAPDQVGRFIFMTGGVYTASSREFLDRISNRCIDKPFDLAALRALIASSVQ